MSEKLNWAVCGGSLSDVCELGAGLSPGTDFDAKATRKP